MDEQLRFGSLCQKAGGELGELVTPMLAAARDELRLPFDAEAFNRIVREARQSAAVDIATFYEEVQSIVKGA